MNPFSKYIDCINCGNELTNLSELALRTPDELECDFCGQEYPGLAARVKRLKTNLTVVYILIALLIFWLAFTRAGFTAGLFAMFPVFILFIYTLGYTIQKMVKF